jgi:small-conductance mechanosensitive channel
MLPVVVFVALTYILLALIDVGHELRLVAIALINASIVSRLVLAVSAFLFAPDTSHLRLWHIGDETAQYIHHWVRRLTFVSVYGFFGLQIGLLMGLDAPLYLILLRLLGLSIVALLLVLIAQNREEVARAIAGGADGDGDGNAPLTSLIRGLARVWHLATGLYLILVYGIWAIQVRDGAEFVVKSTVVSLLVIAVTLLIVRALDRLFDQGLRLSSDLRERFPGLERRLSRYFPVLRKISKLLVSFFAALLVADAWGIDALGGLVEGAGRGLLGSTVNVLLILMVSIFIWELASGVIERYLARADAQELGRYRSPRTRTLLTVGRNALLVLVSVVATLMILSELGINIAPLLAGAGVVGLAIGFGAQRLVQDVINGVFILFQDLMSVGDVVKLGDYVGVVEALSIRTVRLRDLSGTVHTVPFSSIEGVSNLTREFSYHVFEIGIAYREDVDSVIELIKSVGAEMREDETLKPLILDNLEVFGLDAFGDSAIVIKGQIKTRPIKQWQVGRAFNRLIKMRFDEAGIEIPFPHRTLYFGQDKNGDAPRAFIQLENMIAAATKKPDPAGSTWSAA